MSRPELLAARDELFGHLRAGALPTVCAIGLAQNGERASLLVCASDDQVVERAVAQGFLASEVPIKARAAAGPARTLAVPPSQLSPSIGEHVVIGDSIGPFERSNGRLGAVIVRGKQVLALTAGHLFVREGEEVYRGDRSVGRVLRLARPGNGLQLLDAAVLELRTRPSLDLPCVGLTLAGEGAEPLCGEEVHLVSTRRCSRGRVCMVSAVARVSHGPDEYWLQDQFVVEASDFAVPGDSGCALVGTDGRVRGMLVAGEAGLFVATPILQLLAAFGLAGAMLLPGVSGRAA